MRKKTPKLTPTGKVKKKPVYNKNSAIRSHLRRAFSRSPIVWEVLKDGKRYVPKFNKDGSRAKKDAVETHCQVCDTWTRAPMKVAVDHIEPVVPTDGSFDPQNPDWNMFVDRLWCDKSNLQRICSDCHDKKTAQEREIRAAIKKQLKEKP